MAWGYSDDSRQAAAKLLAAAQAGDIQAAMQLKTAASQGGWRPAHQNAAIDAWNQYNPGTEGDLAHEKNPHGFLGDWGEVIGGGLKKLAPLAGVIPGIGVPLAMGLGAVGSAAGGALQHDKFNLGKTLAAGGAAGAEAAWNPFGSKGLPPAPAIPNSPGLPASPSTIGNMTQGMPAGSPATPAVGSPAGPGLPSSISSGAGQPAISNPGILAQLGNQFKDASGKIDFGKLAQLGGAGLGIIDKRQQRNATTRMYDTQLAMQKAAIAAGEQNYASKSGIRDQALARLSQARGSSIFGS